MTITIHTYKDAFVNKLNERDRNLIRVYEEYCSGAEEQISAQIEGEQRGFFVNEAVENAVTLDVRSTKTRSATSYSAAGKKAAKTRQENAIAKLSKEPSKTSRKTLAHRAGALPKAEGRTCKTFTDEQLCDIMLSTIAEHNGELNSKALGRALPTNNQRYIAIRDRLVSAGKIRCEGKIRTHTDGPRVYGARWFLA